MMVSSMFGAQQLHCLPGWSFDSSVFCHLAEHLYPQIECRYCDLPGHGDAPDPAGEGLEAMLEVLMERARRLQDHGLISAWRGQPPQGDSKNRRLMPGISRGGGLCRQGWRQEASREGLTASATTGLPDTSTGRRFGVLSSSPQSPPIWLGWSLGGSLALEMWRRGLPMKALIMLAVTPRFCAADDWPAVVAQSELEAMREGLARGPQATVKRFRNNLGRVSAADRQAVRGSASASEKGLAAGLAALAQADLRPVLDDLAARGVPSLWIGGGDDPLIPPLAVASAARRAAGERLLIEAAGHLPHVTHSREVAEQIDDFVKRRAM